MQIADGRGFDLRISKPWLTRPGVKAGARLLPVVLLVAALGLRVAPLLARYPLHRDEALYGAWAQLIAHGTDPLLLTAWVDKPPLAIYLLAGSLRMFGTSELALRLPGMLASALCVALTYGFTRRGYDRRAATLAAILLAASPFAILFAPTAFTDPWLTVWLLASAWAALAGKPFWAGILLGLAVASKQQGVLAAPLVLGLMTVRAGEEAGAHADAAHVRTFAVQHFLPALAGFLVIFIPLTYWDSLRWAKRPSFWGRSLDTYGGLRVSRPGEWLSRLFSWAQQTAFLYGSGYATILILALGLLPGIQATRRLRAKVGARLEFAQRIDVVLLAYVMGYLALHVLVTFQPWDRYLLPLLPLVAVLGARGMLIAWQGLRRSRRRAALQPLAIVSTACLLAWTSWLGVAGRLPVGSDHGAFDNLQRIIAFTRSRPADAMIYHHSLGWYFDFYLFDAPQEHPWWENGWKLADLANRVAYTQPRCEQWLVLTAWEDPVADGISAALANWGLALREEHPVYRRDGTRGFTVYQIMAARGRMNP